MIKLIEKKKEGKAIQRKFEAEITLAEKMLRKNDGWTLPDNSPYIFKDGALVKKAKEKKEDK